MSGLFCPVSTSSHAAPSPGATSRVIREEQRAPRPLARPHIGKIFVANEFGQRPRKRQKQRLSGLPMPLRPPRKAQGCFVIPIVFLLCRHISNDDLSEFLLAHQELVKGSQLFESISLNRATHMFVYEWFKPVPKSPRLCSNCIKLARKRAFPEAVQYVVRYETRQLKPMEKVFSRREPFDLGVCRDGNGVEEVQSHAVRDKEGCRAGIFH